MAGFIRLVIAIVDHTVQISGPRQRSISQGDSPFFHSVDLAAWGPRYGLLRLHAGRTPGNTQWHSFDPHRVPDTATELRWLGAGMGGP